MEFNNKYEKDTPDAELDSMSTNINVVCILQRYNPYNLTVLQG